MDFQKNFFPSEENKIRIPDSAQVIWVNDMFVEDYVGGGELTSEALIQSSPFEVYKLHSRDVTMELLQQGHQKYWIFSNFAAMDAKLIPSIVGNLKYSIVEYDYKYCRYRSPGRHKEAEQRECNCQNEMHGKLISTLYYQARSIFWMSEKQMVKYIELFPFLSEKKNTVLSSVFDTNTLAYIKALREKYGETERKGWVVLGSPSWIKGAEQAKTYCEENNLDYEVVWGMPYEKLLEKLAQSEGLVYLARCGDTCPRLIIEARLLNCKLVINKNTEHYSEEWFHFNGEVVDC